MPVLYFFILRRRRGLGFVGNVQCSPCRPAAVPAVVYLLALFAAVTKRCFRFFSTHTQECARLTHAIFFLVVEDCFSNVFVHAVSLQLLDNCFVAISFRLCRKTRCQVKAFGFCFSLVALQTLNCGLQLKTVINS